LYDVARVNIVSAFFVEFALRAASHVAHVNTNAIMQIEEDARAKALSPWQLTGDSAGGGDPIDR
jgi:hypothetical protein